MKIKVKEVSLDFILNHSTKEYNPKIWKDHVTSMLKYKDVTWFCAEPQNGYNYERFFVRYTIAEGLTFISPFDYTSSLSDIGFARVLIYNGELETKGFGKDGTERVVNNKQGRKWLVDNICKRGIAVTQM